MRDRHRWLLRAVLVTALLTVGAVAAVPTAAYAADRARIVDVAYNQWSDPSHNHEIGGYNCNFFTSYFVSGSPGCTNGWRTQEWCADFARFVWGRAGVAYTGQLSPAAYSFYAYGVNHGTWHGGNLSGIQPGDVIVYGIGAYGPGTARHVAIYVGNSLVISGNAGPNTNEVYRQLTSSLGYLGVSGYTRPV